jgi:large subunit ribosomal protein L10
LEGGDKTLAISKERKQELVNDYQDWLKRSRAVIVTEYIGLSMNDLDKLRSQIRESGGEFHVIKNTLAQRAFEEAGFPVPAEYFEGSTAAGFAFEDAPGLAKTMTEFARTMEFLKIKGGYLDSQPVSEQQIQALADLPPLPVLRARLLGTLLAPASKLARTLAEPGRQLAAVVRAYADQEASTAAG